MAHRIRFQLLSGSKRICWTAVVEQFPKMKPAAGVGLSRRKCSRSGCAKSPPRLSQAAEVNPAKRGQVLRGGGRQACVVKESSDRLSRPKANEAPTLG